MNILYIFNYKITYIFWDYQDFFKIQNLNVFKKYSAYKFLIFLIRKWIIYKESCTQFQTFLSIYKFLIDIYKNKIQISIVYKQQKKKDKLLWKFYHV